MGRITEFKTIDLARICEAKVDIVRAFDQRTALIVFVYNSEKIQKQFQLLVWKHTGTRDLIWKPCIDNVIQNAMNTGELKEYIGSRLLAEIDDMNLQDALLKDKNNGLIENIPEPPMNEMPPEMMNNIPPEAMAGIDNNIPPIDMPGGEMPPDMMGAMGNMAGGMGGLLGGLFGGMMGGMPSMMPDMAANLDFSNPDSNPESTNDDIIDAEVKEVNDTEESE